jgi:hypothetical protein
MVLTGSDSKKKEQRTKNKEKRTKKKRGAEAPPLI